MYHLLCSVTIGWEVSVAETRDDGRYDALKLKNQLCFPLYACAKEVVRRYAPYLDEIGLTYTQYIAMMALWEYGELSVKDLGALLYLDSGTLTPLLKKLEAKGYVVRHRCSCDERKVMVGLTEEGLALRDRAVHIPQAMGSCLDLEAGEIHALHAALHRLLGTLTD